MADESPVDEERDGTHFWVNCPGCGHGGEIGVPINYPAEVVTCPKCRENVRVRLQDRVLWRPADAGKFLEKRFPHVDWKAFEQKERSEPPKHATALMRAERPAPAANPPAALGERASEPSHRVSRRPMTQTASRALDNDLVLFGMLIAATVLPLAVAIVLTRPHEAARGAAQANVATSKVAKSRKPARPKPASPRSAADAYRRARLRLAKRDDAGAICDLDDALRLKPDFVWCFYYRAGAYSRMGNQERALRDLNQAIRAMPTEAKAWRARAMVHQRMARLGAAVDDIYHAVELANRRRDADGKAFAAAVREKADQLVDELYHHATVVLRAGRAQAAIAGFSAVVRRKPKLASAWLRRALAYDSDCQFDHALTDLNTALRLRPGPADAYKMRSVLHERNEDYASALADMRAARRLTPGRADYDERIRWLLGRQQAQLRSRQVARR